MDNDTSGLATVHSRTARLLAVEVLLADAEVLADDVLESCLYLLRERINEAESEGDKEIGHDSLDTDG